MERGEEGFSAFDWEVSEYVHVHLSGRKRGWRAAEAKRGGEGGTRSLVFSKRFVFVSGSALDWKALRLHSPPYDTSNLYLALREFLNCNFLTEKGEAKFLLGVGVAKGVTSCATWAFFGGSPLHSIDLCITEPAAR